MRNTVTLALICLLLVIGISMGYIGLKKNRMESSSSSNLDIHSTSPPSPPPSNESLNGSPSAGQGSSQGRSRLFPSPPLGLNDQKTIAQKKNEEKNLKRKIASDTMSNDYRKNFFALFKRILDQPNYTKVYSKSKKLQSIASELPFTVTSNQEAKELAQNISDYLQSEISNDSQWQSEIRSENFQNTGSQEIYRHSQWYKGIEVIDSYVDIFVGKQTEHPFVVNTQVKTIQNIESGSFIKNYTSCDAVQMLLNKGYEVIESCRLSDPLKVWVDEKGSAQWAWVIIAQFKDKNNFPHRYRVVVSALSNQILDRRDLQIIN